MIGLRLVVCIATLATFATFATLSPAQRLLAGNVDTVVRLEALPGSIVTIRGSTTIGLAWQCATDAILSTIVVAPAEGPLRWASVQSVRVTVPVAALRCQSRPMERAMRSALRADTPEGRVISFALVRPRAVSTGGACLSGTLTAAGVQRAVELHAELDRAADGAIVVGSRARFTLTSFGIAPPRVLLGAVRARDEIEVELSLRLGAAPRAS